MRIRPLAARDQALLWDLLHVALWDPPPAGPRPRAVLDLPEVRIYAEHRGRSGDVGVLGEDDHDAAIGACWMRLIDGGRGLAYVDDATPQLGIAVLPPFQRRGHGAQLLRGALDAARDHGHRQVSLTVHPDNPAIALYERFGFRSIDRRRSYHLMIATLA